jgi:hypothetical protein
MPVEDPFPDPATDPLGAPPSSLLSPSPQQQQQPLSNVGGFNMEEELPNKPLSNAGGFNGGRATQQPL